MATNTKVGLRQGQKRDTRRRVLDAARDLFEEVGFEEATVRAIAERAGVSVGSVFGSFTSKADLLSQVMLDRLEELYGELERTLPLMRGSTLDRLCSLFAIHSGFEMQRPRLFLAHIADAYRPNLEPGVVPAGRNLRLKGMVADLIRDGMERGEVRKDLDVDIAMGAIVACYMWNYTRVAAGGADAAALNSLMDAQIALIYQGMRQPD